MKMNKETIGDYLIEWMTKGRIVVKHNGDMVKVVDYSKRNLRMLRDFLKKEGKDDDVTRSWVIGAFNKACEETFEVKENFYYKVEIDDEYIIGSRCKEGEHNFAIRVNNVGCYYGYFNSLSTELVKTLTKSRYNVLDFNKNEFELLKIGSIDLDTLWVHHKEPIFTIY